MFMSESVNYLGHRIDQEGLHPTEEKLEAIRDAPKPRNVTELRSYLGLLTYYSKFLPNLASTINPLYRLLLKSSPWHWGNREQKAFEASKQLLLSSQLLAHYDPQHALVLACDASPYGLGAVISHHYPDGSECPIGYASKTLTGAEKNYSQRGTSRRPPGRNSPCFRCGRSGYGASKCRFKSATCHKCGKMGHIKAVCWSSVAKEQKPQHQGPFNMLMSSFSLF